VEYSGETRGSTRNSATGRGDSSSGRRRPQAAAEVAITINERVPEALESLRSSQIKRRLVGTLARVRVTSNHVNYHPVDPLGHGRPAITRPQLRGLPRRHGPGTSSSARACTSARSDYRRARAGLPRITLAKAVRRVSPRRSEAHLLHATAGDLCVLHNACATDRRVLALFIGDGRFLSLAHARIRGRFHGSRKNARNDAPRSSRQVSRTLSRLATIDSRNVGASQLDTRCVSLPPFLSGDTRERAAVAGKRETAAFVARRAAPTRSNVIWARARAREQAACHARRASHRYYNIGQSAALAISGSP